MTGVSWVSPPVFSSLLLLGLVSLAPADASANEEVGKAWELVARHLPGDALAQLKKATGGGREAALAQAVILMDSQPVTDERLADVAARFKDLARGDDEVGEVSGYLLGRLYQTHFFQPDPVHAALAYEDLVARHPTSYWAQLARVKLALLRLYVLPEPAEPAARVALAESLLAQVTDPELRRDLHLVIGRARLFHRLPGVIPHLVEAARVGGLTGVPRGDLQLQIAELSRRAGDLAQARVFFEQFIAENEVDPRVYAVRVKLAEIAAATPTGKAVAP